MWQDKNNSLYKKFEFKDFKVAFKFITDVAWLAEEKQHHPRWLNDWNKVEIWLTSHDVGSKVTEKDQALSKEIDKIYRKYA